MNKIKQWLELVNQKAERPLSPWLLTGSENGQKWTPVEGMGESSQEECPGPCLIGSADTLIWEEGRNMIIILDFVTVERITGWAGLCPPGFIALPSHHGVDRWKALKILHIHVRSQPGKLLALGSQCGACEASSRP